jgi:uncharacterized protein YjiS (DUF1127 family)
MSSMQVKPFSTVIVTGPWRAAGAALGVLRRIAAVLALWRGGPVPRRRARAPRYIDDRLLADIGLTRLDLKLPSRDFIHWVYWW